MATDITLVVYIDPQLMEPDLESGLPRVGNLTLARKVGGVANVIFQSRHTHDFSHRNEFQWGQSYKISASSVPPQHGAFVKAQCMPQPISAGYMCDWLPDPSKFPFQYMPPARPGDAGFKAQYPDKQGMFGTKNQPAKWFNQIWCSTAGGSFSCIYTDNTTYPGNTYRGYQVENNYQLSWESSNHSVGLFDTTWTSPYTFSIPPTTDPAKNVKYLSWGYPSSNGEPTWFNYGTTDPGQHDPSKAPPPTWSSDAASASAIVTFSNAMSAFASPPFAPASVGFRLDWTGPSYSNSSREENARAMFQYISQSTYGWLNINDIYIGLYVSGRASLRQDTSFGDYIPGETQAEKIRYYLRGVVACVSPRFSPNLIDWNYSMAYDISTTSLGGTLATFRLIWTDLSDPVSDLAEKSLDYLRPVIIQAIMSQFPEVAVAFEPIVVNGHNASADLDVINCPPNQIDQVFNIINQITTKERSNPQAINPDPVTVEHIIRVPPTDANGDVVISQTGFQPTKFNDAGFKKVEFNDAGFSQGGFQQTGFQPNGFFNQAGFSHGVFQQTGFQPAGSTESGFSQGGFQPAGSTESGFSQGGFQQTGFQPNGLNQAEFSQGGFQQTGFQPNGFKQNGFNETTPEPRVIEATSSGASDPVVPKQEVESQGPVATTNSTQQGQNADQTQEQTQVQSQGFENQVLAQPPTAQVGA